MADETNDKEKLRQAVEVMLQHHDAWTNKQEAKLWREIPVPCGLAEMLSHLTKDELSTIRSNLGLRNMSSLKKQDLAKKLVEHLPLELDAVLQLVDEERYSLLKSICDNGGWRYIQENREPALDKVEYFRGLGLIFSGSLQGKRVLAMPLELVELFRKLEEDQKWRQQVRLNTEWIKLTHGLLYYYGVLSMQQIQEKLGELTEVEPELIQVYWLLLDAENYYGQVIRCQNQFYSDSSIEDYQEILGEHQSRQDLAYYPFTKEELLKAGEEDYFNRNPAFKSLTKFLLDNYRIKRVEAEEIVADCQDMIREDMRPEEIIQYMGNRLEFPSFELVQLLTEEVNNLMNNTRLWVLKGHTPQEVLKLEPKTLLPLAPTVGTEEKVGRNEPCPCGSGKKYKKCCGDTGNVVHVSFRKP